TRVRGSLSETCYRRLLRSKTLYRGSPAGARFAPHAFPTPPGARRPALRRVGVLHLQPWKTRSSARVRRARGRNRPQRHEPQLSRRGGLRAPRPPPTPRPARAPPPPPPPPRPPP